MEVQTDAIRPLVAALLDAIGLFERVQRRFHPAMIGRHAEVVRAQARELEAARAALPAGSPGPSGGCEGYGAVLRAADLVLQAAAAFGAPDGIQGGVFSSMRAMRKVCRAQEILFELRRLMPEVDAFFRETPRDLPAGGGRLGDGGGRIVRMGSGADPYARGAASLFVPEHRGRARPLPLVIALHGGFGHGRDFIWTWVREARSRGFFLLAPTSLGTTWRIESPQADLAPILDRVEQIAGRYPVDWGRVLLTGLSDGGTFALACAMLPSTPFSAFAPVSCALPPGDVFQAAGRRIFWIHGAYDWMFPLESARQGCAALKRAGADALLRIVADLAHAYPCEENGAILAWFESRQAP